MSFEMDPSLLQDFLTESAELIEQLDADLVKIEAASSAGDAAELQNLCNSAFRALHTIKGAASFLSLTNVTTFAHAAEDALNRLRKGDVAVTPVVMDALLQAADVVRRQIEALCAGEPPVEGPQELIERLHGIAEGAAAETTAAGEPQALHVAAEAADSTSTATAVATATASSRPLQLGPQKLDLLEFMVTDLQEYSKQIDSALDQLRNDATRVDATHHLAEIADSMVKTAEFFELDDLTRAVKALADVAPKLNEAQGAILDEIIIRIRGLKHLVDEQAKALIERKALHWPLETLINRLQSLASGVALDLDVLGQHHNDVLTLLALDGAVGAPAAAVAAPAEAQPIESTAAPLAIASEGVPAIDDEASRTTKAAKAETTGSGASAGEQTIRVEVSRLESLLNLVGQLVLNKNRVLALTRGLRDVDIPHETAEQFNAAAGDLDRLMSELQVGVMRTRMQPLAKLFDRYPRVIRDVARMTDKKISLEIEGKDTEVDKSVLELLADPLVHILRNSADHGVEMPAKRREAGKPEEGTIRLSAEHQGSHVRVAITDDGKGLDREVIGRKAVEKGLTTPELLVQMPDQDVFRFIFEAGFSTAEKITDLSGRGVGMDVVRTNIAKLNGAVNIESVKGQGTTIEILIPLTVAIMPAMVVGVGKHLYCIPLQCVVEIVRPEASEVHTVAGQRVMKLRDSVLPLVDMQKRLLEAKLEDSGRFAVVVGAGGHRVGLVVDKLVGQQEIVIKPLDDVYTQGGPFSGATIREDGEVSLILDVVQLVRTANSSASGTGAPLKKAA